MLIGGGNAFPDKRVPEIYRRLQLVRFYKGGVTYDQLQDGELFDAAYTMMVATNDADNIIQQRNEAKVRAAQARR